MAKRAPVRQSSHLNPEDIIERLSGSYGLPVLKPTGDPLGELILTVLSQNTSDSNSGRAFTALLARFGSWDEVEGVPVDELVDIIRIGGLAQQKAPRIQAILARVHERSGNWDLSFLGELPVDDAREWLLSLPGVGPKTAACVLLFALGRPAIPVDTHVERVGKRLGLIPDDLTAERAHEHLEKLIKPDDYYALHMLLIKHGRRMCKARKPACGECSLQADCPFGRNRSGT